MYADRASTELLSVSPADDAGEAEVAGTAEVQNDFGICLGRQFPAGHWRAESIISAGGKHARPGSKRGYANVGGMVSEYNDWLLLRFVVVRDGADASSKQIKEEVLKWGAPRLFY